jgi:hypothetical protein
MTLTDLIEEVNCGNNSNDGSMIIELAKERAKKTIQSNINSLKYQTYQKLLINFIHLLQIIILQFEVWISVLHIKMSHRVCEFLE